jgi:hypothetical protein
VRASAASDRALADRHLLHRTRSFPVSKATEAGHSATVTSGIFV